MDTLTPPAFESGFAKIISSGILNREYDLNTDIAKAYIDFMRDLQKEIDSDIMHITAIDKKISPQHTIRQLSNYHNRISELLTILSADYKDMIQHQLDKLKSLHIALKQNIGRPKKYHTAIEKAEARRVYRARYKAKHQKSLSADSEE